MRVSRSWFLLALLALPTLWLASWWMFDVVRVVAALLGLGLVFSPRLRALTAPDLGRAGRVAVGLFAGAWVALLVAHQLSRLALGLQGIDFAIFSQVVDGIAHRGEPSCTLATSPLRNFLWHHFCPVLYLPGLISWLGAPAPVAAVLVHAAGAAIGFGALFVTAKQRLGETVAAAVLLTGLLASSVRTELFWGLHDETYALAFVGLALSTWLAGRFELAALFAALTGTCKESFFPFMAWFALLAVVFHADFHARDTAPRARRALLGLVPLGTALTVGYFFLQPMLSGKQFDHLDKLATLDALVSPAVLAAKLGWLGSVLAASVGLGLLTRQGRVVLAMALPFIGLVFVSGYPEMWRPFGYYALIPSVIALYAAVVSLERLKRPALTSAPALVFAVSFALCFTTNLPLRDVVRAAQEDGFSPAHLAWLPSNARVVADPGAALALLRVDALRRMALVGDEATPAPFDFVVYRPGGWEALPENLERLTVPCHPSGKWAVRCPR